MKRVLKLKKLIIENTGFTEIVVKVYEIGSGSPKIAILNGLHGCERTGAYLMGKLFEKINVRKGTISLIPFANPSSALKNTRLTPEDNQDLNRLFPGDKNGTFSFRLAAALFNYLKNFDLTIDIHTFPKMQIPIVAVYTTGAGPELKEKLLKTIRVLGPDFIWKLDTQNDEKNKAGSLIEVLTKINCLAFSLEVPDIEIISQTQEKKVVDGLVEVIEFMINRRKPVLKKSKIPIINRIASLTPASGFFVPRVAVNQRVKKGESLGQIIDLGNPKRVPVFSLENGPVVFILKKTFVLTGERVAIVGKIVKE